ncbi:urease accessory protein [Inquilinus ginsengisoli]|uniref:Urease accessory protein n=1 Tax=Inquilinus ginsengisoli TaxID=363840 RepID=A0ABU1JV06_9PROT|nr:HupE/UreJ family protein [Inquilinus ginsengisoli]MDR6291390.1 urease accessory protein [Inquilinus ginsengisoli]
MRFAKTAALAVLATLLPVAAYAHPGHDVSGFTAGFAHPLSGLDHILAMVAVGIWAGQVGGRYIWQAPLAFLALMALGGLAGIEGLGLPMVEIGIAGSIVVFGAMIALAVRPVAWIGMAVTGVFAVFHGYAHGAEMHPDASALTYGVGFMVATAILHGAGIGVALGLNRLRFARVERALGAAIAVAGVVIAAG